MAPDTLSLAGKTAIVTGSGRENGIGAAIAAALARNGARVAINYVSDASADRAAKVAANIRGFGATVIVIKADVSTPAGAAKLISEALTGLATDRIDILVNNAGAGTAFGKMLVDLEPEEVQTAFSLNAFSALYTTQAAVPHIPAGGRIVNVGTVVSRFNNLSGVGVYGASKAALEYLTGALAAELGPSKGITVNTVAPGPVATDAAAWLPEGEVKDEINRKITIGARLDRAVGRPEEVADAVLLVVSRQAGWITGQYIAASGGISA